MIIFIRNHWRLLETYFENFSGYHFVIAMCFYLLFLTLFDLIYAQTFSDWVLDGRRQGEYQEPPALFFFSLFPFCPFQLRHFSLTF